MVEAVAAELEERKVLSGREVDRVMRGDDAEGDRVGVGRRRGRPFNPDRLATKKTL